MEYDSYYESRFVYSELHSTIANLLHYLQVNSARVLLNSSLVYLDFVMDSRFLSDLMDQAYDIVAEPHDNGMRVLLGIDRWLLSRLPEPHYYVDDWQSRLAESAPPSGVSGRFNSLPGTIDALTEYLPIGFAMWTGSKYEITIHDVTIVV